MFTMKSLIPQTMTAVSIVALRAGREWLRRELEHDAGGTGTDADDREHGHGDGGRRGLHGSAGR